MLQPDLADRVFGHLVSTELANHILHKFIIGGVVELCKDNICVSGTSPEVTSILKTLLEEANIHDHCSCDRKDSHIDSAGEGPNRFASSSGPRACKKQVNEAMECQTLMTSGPNYSFSWVDFPSSTSDEDKLVEFFNKVIDLAWEAAKEKLNQSKYQLKNRFAAPKDKKHSLPLSYGSEGENVRPDFIMLPIEAFSEDMKMVDERYINFTTALTVGELKRTDLESSLSQVHRYARGLRRAQPWVHFVVALTVMKDRVALLRGDSSGTQRLEWTLSHGRGCIKFIRVMLGHALAEPTDLGQNPDVELGTEEIECKLTHSRIPSEMGSGAFPGSGSDTCSNGRAPTQVSDILARDASTVSYKTAPSKRSRGEVGIEHEDSDGNKPSRKKRMVSVDRLAFIPLKVYGHACIGILFMSSSIPGRVTTVFCVVDLEDNKRLLALKMSWHDLVFEAEQNEVMDRLHEQKESHPNIIIPFKTFKALKKGKPCTTLGGIRGIPDDHLAAYTAENRVLTISLAVLKRPTIYFWGAHDFVRGIRGAILGHEYLTRIGILHRDISENNIVLGRHPGEESGYLIDFDLAILQDSEKIPDPVAVNVGSVYTIEEELEMIFKSSSPIPEDDGRPLKALQAGTTPYMSFNVLYGRKHTHYDDLESFLYVILFFFLSYAGPLSKKELMDADRRGFTQMIGSRELGHLSHIRPWPEAFNNWVDGDHTKMATVKDIAFSSRGTEIVMRNVKKSLKNNWSSLSVPISILLLKCWCLFVDSRLLMPGSLPHTRVEHHQFVEVLDRWLERYGDLEEGHSNCPFR